MFVNELPAGLLFRQREQRARDIVGRDGAVFALSAMQEHVQHAARHFRQPFPRAMISRAVSANHGGTDYVQTAKAHQAERLLGFPLE